MDLFLELHVSTSYSFKKLLSVLAKPVIWTCDFPHESGLVPTLLPTEPRAPAQMLTVEVYIGQMANLWKRL